MPTQIEAPIPQAGHTHPSALTNPGSAWSTLAICVALAVATLLLQGYHPLAEDGGLYAAGIAYKLNPSLFPFDRAFVTEHLSYSIFAPVLAALTRWLHTSLLGALLLAEFASLLLTFFSTQMLLRRITTSRSAQLCGPMLLAAWWTMPIAGTSLLMMDPYVTARSFTTPLSLLAIALALDDWSTRRPALLCVATLLVAFLLHPLMSGYAIGFVIVLRLLRSPRAAAWLAGFTLIAFATATAVAWHARPEPPAVVAATLSRYYWFLSRWQWYELAGIVGPLVVLGLLLLATRRAIASAQTRLLHGSVFYGLLGIAVALVFAHANAANHAVARLQPLRVFLQVYLVMTLELGAALPVGAQWLTTRLAGKRSDATRLRVKTAVIALVLCGMAGAMFTAQRASFPRSPQVELPGIRTGAQNPWVSAFLWARSHTSANAVFALDARYVNEDGEDAQTFRAWALRSALPDYSKDGGEAAITPRLADLWLQAATAQQHLSQETDAVRDAKILPLGATWMIVHTSAITQHPCPYINPVVKVCRLQP